MANPNAKPPDKGFRDRPEHINRKGRPPKLFTSLVKDLREQGYESITPTRIKEAYEMLLALPQSKLKEIMEDDHQPVIFKVLIKALTSQRGVEVIDRMLDRAHGKPNQQLNHHVSDFPTPVIVVNSSKK